MKSVLIFQPTIGVYRVDLFNKIAITFKTNIYVEYLQSDFEIFDSSSANSLLKLKPNVLKKFFKIGSRQIYRGYWSAIKDSNPDIVIVSEFGIDALAAIAYRKIFRKNYKIVSICDDSYHMLSSDWDFSRFHKLMRKIVTPLLDEIIVVEPESKDWYHDKYQKGYFYPIISQEQRIREDYHNALPISEQYIYKYELKDRFICLYVGRLIEVKNIKTLISAFHMANIKESSLIIVGDGNQREELYKLAKEDNVIFTGRLSGDNLYAWYNIADVFILPSIIEPFGAVTNEALIGGCKVLVSNNAGSRCLVRNGFNGYIIDPCDKYDISNKLNKIHNEIFNDRGLRIPKLRDSLMEIDFESLSDELINHLQNL